ncbi:MAG: hypothetical protein ACBR15_17775 [Microcoleus sp.]
MNYRSSGIAIALKVFDDRGRSLFRLYILSLVQRRPLVKRYDNLYGRNGNLRDSQGCRMLTSACKVMASS